MTQGLRQRLAFGIGANAFGQIVSIAIQVVSVPIFIKGWGVNLYGEWLTLNLIPSYLTFSDVGFSTIAANEMTISISEGRKDRALKVFHSVNLLISLISLFIISVASLLIFSFQIHKLLNFKEQNNSDVSMTIILLVIFILLNLRTNLMDAAFKSIGHFATGTFIRSSMRLFSYATVSIFVLNGAMLKHAALVLVISKLLENILMTIILSRLASWISYGFKYAKFSTIKELFYPALAFMNIPLGNALNNQGIVTTIAVLLGPTSVVLFSTLRTISRLAWQFVNIINRATWPEISIAYGKKDFPLIRKIHHKSCQVSLWASVILSIVLFLAGQSIINILAEGKLTIDKIVYINILITVVINSLWQSSSTLLNAISQHKETSRFYIFSSLLGILISFFLTSKFNILGAALSVLIVDVLMLFYVFRKSLKLLDESFLEFINTLKKPPVWIIKNLSS